MPPSASLSLFLLFCYITIKKKRFGEALGTLRSIFLSTVASILRLIIKATMPFRQVQKHSYIFTLASRRLK
jgi:hypothetical protein